MCVISVAIVCNVVSGRRRINITESVIHFEKRLLIKLRIQILKFCSRRDISCSIKKSQVESSKDSASHQIKKTSQACPNMEIEKMRLVSETLCVCVFCLKQSRG